MENKLSYKSISLITSSETETDTKLILLKRSGFYDQMKLTNILFFAEEHDFPLIMLKKKGLNYNMDQIIIILVSASDLVCVNRRVAVLLFLWTFMPSFSFLRLAVLAVRCLSVSQSLSNGTLLYIQITQHLMHQVLI